MSDISARRGRFGDLITAWYSDKPTIQRYREIRSDRKILFQLLRTGEASE